jgi:hypothetical protein
MKRPTTLPRWMKRLFSGLHVENIKVVRRVIVSVVGATVLLIGIALLVLPGPAFIVYSGGARHPCNGVRMGATLAQESSSNRE